MHRAEAQDKHYTLSNDPENGQLTYKGIFHFSDLAADTAFASWWAPKETYKPEASAINYLRKHLGSCELLVFLGTWCSDSQEMLPELHTVLQAAGFSAESVRLVGVDRSKDSGTEYTKEYEVKLVPTVIVLYDGKELGRITEVAKKSVEEDLVNILMH